MKRSQEPTKLKVTAILISVLGFIALLNLLLFYDEYGENYLNLIRTLQTHSVYDTIRSNDGFDKAQSLAQNFDPQTNTVFLIAPSSTYSAIRSEEEPWFSWLHYQIDYYFYPTIPEIITFNNEDILAQQLVSDTKKDDLLFSAEEIDLDLNDFTVLESPDYFIYIRK